MNITTLVDALKASAKTKSSLHLISSATDEQQIRYAQLLKNVQGILFHLQQRMQPKQELIIYVDDNRQFLEAYWACLLGNIIPAPISVSASDHHRQKIMNVFNELSNPVIYTSRKILDRLKLFANAQQINIDKLIQQTLLIENIYDLNQPGKIIAATENDIALLQFSSGSTGKPKGVVLTHKNLLTNIRAMIHDSKLSPADSTLSWMPLTHDMGIIGFHLTPLVAGINQYIMPTDLFIRRPLLWLKKASEKKATVLSSPNFGYQHCLKRFSPDKLSGCDLQHVRLILNGAEPISADICREFINAMANFKLNPNCLYPVYGLAEASLAVSFPAPSSGLKTLTIDRQHLALGDFIKPIDANDKNKLEVVNVGKPVQDCEVGIFQEEQAVSENQLGKIKIRGDNVTQGYYRDAAKTKEVINAQGWLDSGDIGFFHRGELYIVGRIKDIIIINGQNFAAHDIERVAGDENLTSEKIVACGVRSPQTNSEELALFVFYKEPIEQFSAIAGTVNQRLSQQLGIHAAHIIPITKIPKTTSGKTQRYLLAEQFNQGEFNAILAELAKHQPFVDQQQVKNNIERALLDICYVHLKKPLSVEDNIFDTGTSSLTLAQIYDDINNKYPNKIEVTDIFDYPTVAELASYIESR